mgnify:CR=1 FL=1
MAVSAVSGTTAGQGGARTAPSNQLDKQVFFQLLVAQLKNQDPLKPWDGEQFVTQLVQFTILEQLLAMNKLLEESLQAAELSRGAALIGHRVKIDTGQGELVEGTVEKVSLANGKVYLHVSGRAYELSQLVEVA